MNSYELLTACAPVNSGNTGTSAKLAEMPKAQVKRAYTIETVWQTPDGESTYKYGIIARNREEALCMVEKLVPAGIDFDVIALKMFPLRAAKITHLNKIPQRKRTADVAIAGGMLMYDCGGTTFVARCKLSKHPNGILCLIYRNDVLVEFAN